MVASFKSNSQQHQYLYEKKVTIPTLHVFGETDGVIPKRKKPFCFIFSNRFVVEDAKNKISLYTRGDYMVINPYNKEISCNNSKQKKYLKVKQMHWGKQWLRAESAVMRIWAHPALDKHSFKHVEAEKCPGLTSSLFLGSSEISILN